MNKKEYMKLKNYLNRNHPELKVGEVWITNIYKNSGHIEAIHTLSPHPKTRVEDIIWKTKRLGTIAYSKDNKVIDGCVPVFVKRSELEDAGIDMRTILQLPDKATIT